MREKLSMLLRKLVVQVKKKMKPPYEKKDFAMLGVILLAVISLPIVIALALQTSITKSQAAETLLHEPENGTLSGDVSIVSDPNAVNGKYIRFGTAAPTPTPPIVPVGSHVLFVGDWETGDFSQWDYCHNHLIHGSCDDYPTNDYALQLINAPDAREGQYAAQFDVRQGDVAVDGGERSEVSTHAAGALTHEGDERWYEWSMKVPANFVTPTANYFLTMQWHDSGNGSPPMAIAISKDGKVYLDPGDESTNVVIGPLRKGVWVDYVLHAKFSQTSGWVEAWENGVQTVQRTPFKTMNDNENFLKEGIYRSSNTPEEAIVWLDKLRITAP
jgi:Polysaccharide lyase